MKKVVSIITALWLSLGLFGFSAFAAGEASLSAEVFVTIADRGEMVLAQEAVTVTDTDNDGALTVYDALYCAHEEHYEGGVAQGYASYTGPYGLSLKTLWGFTDGAFGYYVNNISCMSLADTVKAGDLLYAFVYNDQTGWSDTYCYFDRNTVSAEEGETVTLTLLVAGYDAEWNPMTLPLGEAAITVDGTATSYRTDAEGKVTLNADAAGAHVISATSERATLVPPVCVLTVEGKEPIDTMPIQTDTEALAPEISVTDTAAHEPKPGKTAPILWIVCGVAAFAVVAVVVAVLLIKRKK